MRRLLVYLRPHVPAVGVAFLAIVGGALVDLAQPWLTQQAIDHDIATRDVGGLLRLTMLFLGLLGFGFLCDYFQTFIMQSIGQRIMHTLRMQVYGHLQRLDLKFYDRNPVGRLMTRVTTDVDALNDLFASGVITVFGDILTLAGIMIAMLAMSWRLALVAFVVLPGIVMVTAWFRKHARESYRQVRGLVARLNAFLQEHITGISTVQLFAEEPRIFQKFDAINRGHRDVNIASIFYYAVFYPAIELVAALSGALIIWIGGGWSLDGVVSVGVLVAFLQYSRRFFQPISDLSEKFNILQAAMAASERIFGLLDTPVELNPPAVATKRPPSARGRIEFDHVWFAYEADHYVLRDVSFVVEPGQRIGIVGATGSGKTTIISLLLRFYDVSRGRILVDGVDIRELDMAELRGLVGLVLQDVHMFSGTIAGNIRLGQTSIDDAAVRRAATAVHADPFIRALPEGYASAVAERGSTLSTGQKQLLAFARALAFEPSVLVLDEATSNIDTATEGLIQNALKVLMAGRTVLAIAHRLSTIQDMDRILVLHKGELRESGTHQELLALRGLYHRLYQLQFRDQMPATAS
ncbi:MAG TPA: ABC transporter ATP-binding protein [Vicinamibacterales bacterium]|nr:ABC transporter ATP-binding protein [Vicinamibacterales bacterium]